MFQSRCWRNSEALRQLDLLKLLPGLPRCRVSHKSRADPARVDSGAGQHDRLSRGDALSRLGLRTKGSWETIAPLLSSGPTLSN